MKIAITGKGGVGKSTFTANFAYIYGGFIQVPLRTRRTDASCLHASMAHQFFYSKI